MSSSIYIVVMSKIIDRINATENCIQNAYLLTLLTTQKFCLHQATKQCKRISVTKMKSTMLALQLTRSKLMIYLPLNYKISKQINKSLHGHNQWTTRKV